VSTLAGNLHQLLTPVINGKNTTEKYGTH